VIKVLRFAAQFVIVFALFAGVAAFSNWPPYQQIPSGDGVIMLSFVHGADRRAMCRRLTPEEIAKLPPNMRKTTECPRVRPSLYVEFDIQGRTAYRATLPPTGIAGDGPSKVYERFPVPAGSYDVAVRMRDRPGTGEFDYEDKQRVSLAPGQLLVIDFNPETKRFVFQ
jgi:hypothetical protein